MDDHDQDGSGVMASLAVAVGVAVAVASLAAVLSTASAPVDPAGPVFVEVRVPGQSPVVLRLGAGASMADILAEAGVPATTGVDPARPVRSGESVELLPGGGVILGWMDGPRLLTLGQRIPLNEAGARDLAALPGIGEALAARIVKWRLEHGAFPSVEAVRAVPGVGPKLLEVLKKHARL